MEYDDKSLMALRIEISKLLKKYSTNKYYFLDYNCDQMAHEMVLLLVNRKNKISPEEKLKNIIYKEFCFENLDEENIYYFIMTYIRQMEEISNKIEYVKEDE